MGHASEKESRVWTYYPLSAIRKASCIQMASICQGTQSHPEYTAPWPPLATSASPPQRRTPFPRRPQPAGIGLPPRHRPPARPAWSVWHGFSILDAIEAGRHCGAMHAQHRTTPSQAAYITLTSPMVAPAALRPRAAPPAPSTTLLSPTPPKTASPLHMLPPLRMPSPVGIERRRQLAERHGQQRPRRRGAGDGAGTATAIARVHVPERRAP